MGMNPVAFNVEMKEQAAVGTPLNGGKGTRIVQLNSGWGLAKLAEEIRDTITLEETSIMSEKGIPDGGGHISYVKQQIVNPDKPDADAAVLNAWIGTMALIGLSFRRGYSLSVRPVELSESRTNLVKGYKQCLVNAGTLKEGASELYLVCKDGAPIAVLDEDVILCPFTYIRPAAMADVPWYHPEDTNTRTVAEWEDLRDSRLLSADERQGLLFWLENICPEDGSVRGLGRVRTMLKLAKEVISGNGKASCPEQYPLNLTGFAQQMKAFSFGTNLFTLPNYALEMPKDQDVFSDVLLLVPGAKFTPQNPKTDDKLSQPLTISVPSQGKVVGYGAMLPLREEFTQFLMKHDGMHASAANTPEQDTVVKVESIRLTPVGFDAPPNQIDKAYIQADMKVRVGTESIRDYRWKYKANDTIYCMEEFYNMHLWPNYRRVNPATGEDAWKNYLVTLSTQRSTGFFDKITGGAVRPGDIAGMTMLKPENNTVRLWKDGGLNELMDCEQQVYQPKSGQRDRQCWYHARYDRYPEYISFAVRGKTGAFVQAGCIHPISAVSNNERLRGRMEFAVDFGTSATICMATGENGEPLPVPLHTCDDLCVLVQYYRDLGRDEEEQERAIEFDAEQFEDYYWLGTELRQDGYARTVAQLVDFRTSKQENVPPASGRIFPGTERNLAYFLTQSGSRAKSQKVKDASLNSCGLYANIKLSNMANTRNREAALHYIEHVGEQCLLYALKAGCAEAYFLFSYPDEVCRNNLLSVWREALKKLDGMSAIQGVKENRFTSYEECVAASCYINSRQATPNNEIGYAIMDIGGGTMDISMWRSVQSKAEKKPRRAETVWDLMEPDEELPVGGQDGSWTLHLVAKGSVRYAGNRVLAESLYLTQRYFGDRFKDLWKGEKRGSEFESLVKQLKEIAPSRGNDTPEEIAERLATKGLIVNTLLSETGLASGNWEPQGVAQGTPEEFLRTLIRTKMFGVFYILGSYMKAANAVNIGEMNESLGSYEIRLAGGGAQIIKMCGQKFCRMLPKTIGYRIAGGQEVQEPGGKTGSVMERFTLKDPIDAIKVEVAQGMLRGGETGSNLPRAGQDLELIGTSDSFNAWTPAIYNAYEELIAYYRSPDFFGYQLPNETSARCIYDLLTVAAVGKTYLNTSMQNNFKAARESGLPKAVVADVVAVLTMDDVLSRRLDS